MVVSIFLLGRKISILTHIFQLGRNCELDYTKSFVFGPIFEGLWMYDKLFFLPSLIQAVKLDTHSLIHFCSMIHACRVINEPFMHVHSFPHSICFFCCLSLSRLGQTKINFHHIWLLILPTSWSYLQDHNLDADTDVIYIYL